MGQEEKEGKPVVIKVDKNQIEKGLKRIS